jgi:hypothetical protein
MTVNTPDADGMRRLMRSSSFKDEFMSLMRDDGTFAAAVGEAIG